MKYDIFLSYSRKDIEMMRRIRDDLREMGVTVWTDDALEPGTEVWESEIEKAIRDAASLVILMSPDSYASEWVRNEITLADALNRRIFPVLLRGEQSDSIPLRLIASQWIDARKDYQKALGLLATAVKSQAVRSHTAVTVRAMRPPHTASDGGVVSKESDKSPTRVPLAVGVVATMVVFALVVIALILASQTPDNNTPEVTAESIADSTTVFGSATPDTSSTATPTTEANAAASDLSGQIAFVSNRNGELYDIFILNFERETTQLLWTNPYTEAYVAWSPDGTLLTFTSWTAPDYIGDIYTLRTSDSRLVNLTNNLTEDRYARWSADGTRIAFESERENENTDIYVMNADGTEVENITDAPNSWDHEPAWSPDGEHITFSSDRAGIMQIWSMRADGADAVLLTEENAHFGQAAYSPDGTRIAYTRCIAPSLCDYENVPGTDDNWDIWVMNADGTNATQLTEESASNIVPAWSTDGTRIAFVSYRDGNAEIYVMNADGSDQINVTNNPAEDFGPAWRP